ncbi:glycoside hydrolase family 65 protein [Proteobacteria bacterium 005FR1]|nr:glycoside hydrolase family 65 protein [Proteobacteria bacterium 005FR1]
MSERHFSDWELVYRGWDPAEQALREALTTLGNGHFATRGAAEEVYARGPHYPATYLAGGYNRLESEVAGKIVESEDLVNWPNWLPLSFRCEGCEWFDFEAMDILEYEQRLDFYRGLLHRKVHFRDHNDREFLLETSRFVHMSDGHVAAIDWLLTPLNWSGKIEIRSGIDGDVSNDGVARYRELNGHHLSILGCGIAGEDAIFLVSQTRQSHIVLAQAVRTRATIDGEPASLERRTASESNRIAQHLTLSCSARKPVRIEKVLTMFSSRDFALSEPCAETCKTIHRLPDFDSLRERHELAWRKLWSRADLTLSGQHSYTQPVLRLHIFHMLQTISTNSIGRDVGIPARGLHGEAYRGHVFWDELFTFPFLNLRLPELSRSLLLYRYRRLSEARYAAKQEGYRGAMFPWQSGSDGREESQALHLNPKSGRWIADNTHRQRHVNAAIAFNVWQYYQATGDLEFMTFYGAELLVEIARFWASIAVFNTARGRYEIRGVVGPDEFHTQYPGGDHPGLDNNAYTNVMASWVLHTAEVTLDLLGEDERAELLESLRVSDEDLRHWNEVSRLMYVPFHEDHIVSQFEGWDALEELDWDELCNRHGDIQRLDRVLEAENDDPNRYRATKQADVLMLFFLFSAEELKENFERLGYDFDPHFIPRNVQYYLARTSHGSSLSRVVHAWVLARTQREKSWHLFKDVLASDIDDIQGGTTAEGIHMGAMASSVDLMQRCYTGLEMRHGVLWLNPVLPDDLEQLNFTVRYRGHWLAIQVNHHTLSVSLEKGRHAPARVGFHGTVYEMDEGQQVSFSLGERK